MRSTALRFSFAILFGSLVLSSSQAATITRRLGPIPTVDDPTNLYNLQGLDGWVSDCFPTSTLFHSNPQYTVVSSEANPGCRWGRERRAALVWFDISRLPSKATNVLLWYYVDSSGLSEKGDMIRLPLDEKLNTDTTWRSANGSQDIPRVVTLSSKAATWKGWLQIDITDYYFAWKMWDAWNNNGIRFDLRSYAAVNTANPLVSLHVTDPALFQYAPRLEVTTEGPDPFLSFPLSADLYPQGAYTPRKIITVVDHDAAKGSPLIPAENTAAIPFVRNGYVGAFTGEVGGTGVDGGVAACYAVTNPVLDTANVDVEGLYRGTTPGCGRGSVETNDENNGGLNYDGHPGYDYEAAYDPDNGIFTPVFAAAEGDVKECVPTSEPLSYLTSDPHKQAHTCEEWGMVSIEHVVNGVKYRTQYEHLSDYSIVKPGDHVLAGQKIGVSGKTIPTNYPMGPHLHFEVLKYDNNDPTGGIDGWKFIDPYGWNGKGDDKLEIANGIPNWRLWQ